LEASKRLLLMLMLMLLLLLLLMLLLLLLLLLHVRLRTARAPGAWHWKAAYASWNQPPYSAAILRESGDRFSPDDARFPCIPVGVYSDQRLKLAQLLGRHGAFLTLVTLPQALMSADMHTEECVGLPRPATISLPVSSILVGGAAAVNDALCAASFALRAVPWHL
jgi:hypothetical protein